MRIDSTLTRIIVAIGTLGALQAAGCLTCEEQAEALCRRCEAQDKTAYQCTYRVDEVTSNGQVLARKFLYTGCFDEQAHMEAECQDLCDGYPVCKSVDVTVFDCEGGHCDGGADEVGDDEAGLLASGCEPNWFLDSDVEQDPASGAYVVDTPLWLHLVSAPSTLDCDGAWAAPDVTGAGFVLHDVTPGTLAHALGLADGDLMVSANGMPLGTAPDVDAAFSALRDHTTLQLVVQRGASTVALDYVAG